MSGQLQLPVPGLDCVDGSSLGLANDDDGAGRVAIEVRAATMDHGDSVQWTDDELRGWDMHGVDEDVGPSNDGEECGYLARELATHDDRDDRDADAWPWRIARPIAAQQLVLIEIVVGEEAPGVSGTAVGSVGGLAPPDELDGSNAGEPLPAAQQSPAEHAEISDERNLADALDRGGAA